MANGKHVAAKKQEIIKPTSQQVELFSKDLPTNLPAGTGEGISNKAADNLVPLVYVLQSLSPQCEARDPRHIDGAKAGQIWLRNAPTDQLVDGDEGILWQQCYFYVDWVEWVDRDAGGGFVARYADVDGKPDCKDAVQSQENRFEWTHGENTLKQTRNHVGFVLGRGEPMPYVIPFSGAGHKESRAWMTMMPRRREDGSPANSWDFVWKLTTVFKQNQKGKWFDLHAKERLGYVKPDQWEAGKALAHHFSEGVLKADQAEMPAGEVAETAEAF